MHDVPWCSRLCYEKRCTSPDRITFISKTHTYWVRDELFEVDYNERIKGILHDYILVALSECHHCHLLIKPCFTDGCDGGHPILGGMAPLGGMAVM
ncbi:predicted protein [Pyrenophora tritici-repentis Pt-1C-BFP]|uniref:Uncharacterized protein n=1 Tax=Pyrenophora tritici-repentis (strain Pt-1C-BFP) TaxID=426418 RepID=B2W9N4_PYRTR|nr:uncharacterized protein PTRG_06692 [Pyrenophora tritici-repentis Pt-1C-BFP]EDU49612.1 predicted protein [Pyrenophora tritici-repentis Pt-1C-BFP]